MPRKKLTPKPNREERVRMLRVAGASEEDQIRALQQRDGLTFTQATALLSALPPPSTPKGRRKLAPGAPLVLHDTAPGPVASDAPDDPIALTVQRGYDLGLHERQVGALLTAEHGLTERQAAYATCANWPGGIENSRLPHLVAARATKNAAQ
jgi:hypothetical protein